MPTRIIVSPQRQQTSVINRAAAISACQPRAHFLPLAPVMNDKLSPPAIVQQAVRFAVIGAVATVVHYTILVSSVEGLHATPLWGSSIGFIAGVIVGFFLNRRFTFTEARPLGASFAKYAMVYAIGFVLNATILQTLIHAGLWYLAAQAAATAIVLVWNFIGARFFAFR
jgi:putative flippase GtrA